MKMNLGVNTVQREGTANIQSLRKQGAWCWYRKIAPGKVNQAKKILFDYCNGEERFNSTPQTKGWRLRAGMVGILGSQTEQH